MTATIDPEVDAPHRRITVGRVLAALVVLSIAGFWIYAFSPLAPRDKADSLADRSFVEVANARCRASYAQLDALPRAMQAGSPQERAVVVEQANAVVATMVDGLRAEAAGAAGRDRALLDLWFTDWDAYLASRDRYAADLRSGNDQAVFTVPARQGGQITQTMDGFARVNRITDCLVPLDV